MAVTLGTSTSTTTPLSCIICADEFPPKAIGNFVHAKVATTLMDLFSLNYRSGMHEEPDPSVFDSEFLRFCKNCQNMVIQVHENYIILDTVLKKLETFRTQLLGDFLKSFEFSSVALQTRARPNQKLRKLIVERYGLLHNSDGPSALSHQSSSTRGGSSQRHQPESEQIEVSPTIILEEGAQHLSHSESSNDPWDEFFSTPLTEEEARECLQDNLKETRKSGKHKGSFPCGVCGKVFPHKVNRQKHMIVHQTEKPFPCEQCGKSFKSKWHLRDHSRTHSDERPIECPNCDKRWKTLADLRTHSVVHSEVLPFTCDHCGKSFRYRKSFKVHVKIHADEPDGGGDTIPCEICGKPFQSKKNMQEHKRIHSNHRPILCTHDGCGKTFRNPSEMTRHLAAHSDHRPSVCSKCGKSFKDVHALARHDRGHIEERDFICEECGMGFRCVAHLKDHSKTHDNERALYPCPVCEKRFKRKDTIKYHMRIHTGEKPFTCENCGQSFRLQETWYRHKKRCEARETSAEEEEEDSS